MSMRSAGLLEPCLKQTRTKVSRTTSVLSAPMTDCLISNCVKSSPLKETGDVIFVIKHQEKGFGACGPEYVYQVQGHPRTDPKTLFSLLSKKTCEILGVEKFTLRCGSYQL